MIPQWMKNLYMQVEICVGTLVVLSIEPFQWRWRCHRTTFGVYIQIGPLTLEWMR